MDEPSVLDYVKSKLTPWKGTRLTLPPAEPGALSQTTLVGEEALPQLAGAEMEPTPTEQVGSISPQGREKPRLAITFPWRSLVALALALLAQRAFAPPDRSPTSGILFLLLAIVWVIWAYFRREWLPAEAPPDECRVVNQVADDAQAKDRLGDNAQPEGARSRPAPSGRLYVVGLGTALAFLSFLAASGSKFTILNITLLLFSLAIFLYAFWQRHPGSIPWYKQLLGLIQCPNWQITISRWTLLVIAATALVLFFRFYRLDQVPPEMVSDHAEKYLDVADILAGNSYIFFPRNGGREALQFYLLAALHLVFHAGFTHLTLKFSTALIGFLALPFVYLLGKEIANRRVGLFAFTFAGIAYWTNVVSRAGMRLPFYFLFTAATMYYLVRGLRTSNRNDFLLAGIALGLGLYGYSADRILPLLVIMAVALYLIHRQSTGQRRQTLWYTGLLVLMAMIIFLPLLRYISQDPQGFGYRMFSRMGDLEQPLPGQPVQIFFDNFRRALLMFSWTSGVVWGVSIPDYPALGVVAGGLFYLGLALVLLRYLKRWHWRDLFLILSIPVLMLPSIMALAFPSENPNLYRTGGAMVPVFLLVGIALDGLMSAFEKRLTPRWGLSLAWGLSVLLLLWASLQEYDLVFDKFYKQYALSAWNTSEMGTVIHDFAQTIGSPDTAWVMGFPYWVDTRLVALNAGYPSRDFAMFVDQLPATTQKPGHKLFIIKPEDQVAIDALKLTYPQGWLHTYSSKVETKDFLIYYVPPQQ